MAEAYLWRNPHDPTTFSLGVQWKGSDGTIQHTSWVQLHEDFFYDMDCEEVRDAIPKQLPLRVEFNLTLPNKET
jgi:hypothetical protein